MVITPPLAARLGLAAPLWPVTGDYLDARLYALDEVNTNFVLVVRLQRDVLDRYPIDAATRSQLATVVERGNMLAIGAVTPDSAPSFISEPVRGSFVLNQTLLGGLVFGPAAAAIVGDEGGGAGATAAWLAVTGGMFFTAARLTQSTTVSRAQNHLSWHSARRGAAAANLALFAIAGDDIEDEKAVAFAILAGGIAGDVLGFQIAKPITDAEAHGTSHGSTVTASIAAGLVGASGLIEDNEGAARVAAVGVIAAGALGYPLGLRYVRTAPYRVTAGDVGTLVPAELLAMTAVATLIPRGTWEDNTKVAVGALTAGFMTGAIMGDRLLVRRFDHTEAEARLMMYGTAAGALVGVALPVLANAREPNPYFAAVTIGGVLGAALTNNFIKPAPASQRLGLATGTTRSSPARFGVKLTPESALLAGLGQRGNHSLLSISF